jgi:hypothetical protein
MAESCGDIRKGFYESAEILFEAAKSMLGASRKRESPICGGFWFSMPRQWFGTPATSARIAWAVMSRGDTFCQVSPAVA